MQEVESRNVSPEIVGQVVSSLDKYIVEHYGKPTRRTLRGRQITVFEDLRDTLRGGQTEGYITLPTGVGKTVLFTEFTEALNTEQILETLIVVPTKVLVGQTEEKITEFAPQLEVGKLYTDAHDITRPVTITTYASIVRHIEDGTLDPKRYKLLVLDEVHRSLSQKRIQAVAQFTEAIKLGFTATPMYSEDRQVANLLNTEIHRMRIKEAVEEDLLSPFSAIIAQTDVDLTNISIKSNGDYDEIELEHAINIATRNQAAIDLYQRLFSGKTSVAYCNLVQHAQDLAKLFVENGVSAGFISGYMNKKEQTEVLRKFNKGEIKILCNADILIEGFDEPRASVCLNLRPTRSLVNAQQRGGRVLRIDPDNPNKHAYIVDFLDKTEDPRKLPVTFAEVAEAAFITTKKIDGDRVPGGTSVAGTQTNDSIDIGGLGIHEDVIEISGLIVTVNPQEVMRMIKEIQSRQYILAPDGWSSIMDIVDLTNRDYATVRNRVNILRQQHPEWCNRFVDSRGTLGDFYNDTFVSSITEELTGLSAAPAEWTTLTGLSKSLKKSPKVIRKFIEEYRGTHSEWFKLFLDRAWKKTEHLHPDLILLILDRVNQDRGNITHAPLGWQTVRSLSRILRRSNTYLVQRRAGEYKKLYPDWFREYYDARDRKFEFLSPELVKLIEQDISIIQPPPEGWANAKSIGKLINIKSPQYFASKVRSTANKYRDEHPEWFNQYKDLRGGLGEFYSPTLVEHIKRDLGIISTEASD